MILDWIVFLVCGGGIGYCLVTMPEKMIMSKESYTALAHAVDSKEGQNQNQNKRRNDE